MRTVGALLTAPCLTAPSFLATSSAASLRRRSETGRSETGRGKQRPYEIFCIIAVFLLTACTGAVTAKGAGPIPPKPIPYSVGADISWVQQQEAEGRRFSDQGRQSDILQILSRHGFNWIRLRIFHHPAAPGGYSPQGYCDLAHTMQMAKRLKAAHLKFLLDFHYSDTWADPGRQTKPADWAGLSGAGLKNAVHDETRDVLKALKKQGTPPDMVQIGNEVTNGFLWPDGKVWGSGGWDGFCELLKAGIAGAKAADRGVKIMLHLDCGGSNAKSRLFLDNMISHGVPFDVIGVSYYPRWQGPIENLAQNLTDLAGRYPQDLVVAEYSVPDIQAVYDIVQALPNGKGRGAFLWEPTGKRGPVLFDPQGNANPEIETFSHLTKKK